MKIILEGEQVDFKYPNSKEEFEELLEIFQRKKATSNVNDLGENIKLDFYGRRLRPC